METCVMSPRLRSSGTAPAHGKCSKCLSPARPHALGTCYSKYLGGGRRLTKTGAVECSGKKELKKAVIRRIQLLKRIKSCGSREIAADSSDGSDKSDVSDTAESQGLFWQPRHLVTRRTARISQEVYAVWQRRVGSSACIPADSVQHLFHDLHLYPTKAQVREMLECAKDCSGRSASSYLTFGEFCVFATELKKCYDKGVPRPTQLSRLLERDGDESPRRSRKMSRTSSKHEVFLGGSCNPTTWRTDVAIPMLKKMDITFYNPQVPQWSPELLEIEHHAKENASVMFFVIDNQTRGVSALIEVAHIAGKRRKLILVIQSYTQQRQSICDEVISEQEYEDLRHGQEVLQDLVERQGIPVFDNISVALSCTAKVLRENLTVQQLGLADLQGHTMPARPAHPHTRDKHIQVREVLEALDTSESGTLSLLDTCAALKMLHNRTVQPAEILKALKSQPGVDVDDIHPDEVRLSLEHLCSLAAQLRSCPENGKTTIALRCQLPLVGKNCNYLRDVYLGGTGKDSSSWRETIAIPILKRHGLSFFSPKVCQWSSRLLPVEAAAMEHSFVLLFVITNTARSLSAMAVAAHYIGLGCNVVLCVEMLSEDAIIGTEKLSKIALKDYNRGRMYLTDLAKRDNVPVVNNITEAVECVVRKCQQR